jgi:DNA-binding NarL/FixJ family response regulator
MDLHMPGGGGLDATRAIAAANTAVAVLILTMSEQDDALLAALRAGARGYLNKLASRDELLDCIQAVANGQSVFGPGLADKLIGEINRRQRAPVLPVLTDREREDPPTCRRRVHKRRHRPTVRAQPEDGP